MGLAANNLRHLLEAKARHGVSLTRTATLGRQRLLVTAHELHGILAAFGYTVSASECADLVSRDLGYADSLLTYLGAEEVRSFDASDYEGASMLHDFNLPIGGEHQGRFDLVLDSGSLEHIFFVTTGLLNCMKMVRVGGHVVVMNPANNYLGHGFYQFSPEFYFRSLSEENGFEVCGASVFEGHADPLWYEVLDPAKFGRRSEAATRRQTTLAVVARRTADVPLFARPPQESDYVEAWKTPGSLVVQPHKPLVESARARIPESTRSLYRRARSLLSRTRYGAETFRARGTPPRYR